MISIEPLCHTIHLIVTKDNVRDLGDRVANSVKFVSHSTEPVTTVWYGNNLVTLA